MRFGIYSIAVLIGTGCVRVEARAADVPQVQAGAAKCDITPPVGHPLWGYASRKDAPSTGIRDPLHARALVLSVGDERMALVSLDLGRAPTRSSMAVIRRNAAEAGVRQIFVVGSHTHHGPVLELDDWPTPENSYVRDLEKKLSALIAAAVRAQRPARYGVAGREVTLNRNRHSKRDERPVDRELLVLRVEDLDGKPIAHAVNFAAHVTILPAADRRWSADWPAAMASQIEKTTGAPCLFLQGAAGDLSPNTTREQTPEQFGEAVAEAAAQLLGRIKCKPAAKPALAFRDQELRLSARVDLANPFLMATLSAAFFPALIQFYEREYREGVRPHLSVALLDGRIGFVGVSGEFFCSHALHLKRRARLDHLFFLGYCNDYHQYFPTIEGASEGGYGTEPWISPAEHGAGERIMDRALLHLFQLRGRLK